MSVDAMHGAQGPHPPKKPPKDKGKGPGDLAKALGVSPEQLQKMSPKDVEKLAKSKGINLHDFGNPQGPPPPKGEHHKPNSVFKH